MVEMVIDDCREQVVGGRDRVKVAREVKVDSIRWNKLGFAATGPAALDAKARTE